MKTYTTTHKTNGRKTANDALITLLRVSVIATIGLVLCAGMVAGAFPVDWTHSDLITIEEHSGSDLVDYQIPVELNASNFDFTKAQPDGADIRFAELGGTMLDYWIEAWNSTDENATVWVKVGSVPANGTAAIRMWYGNAGVTSESNGNAVFEFFDDFEETDIDTTKWNLYDGTRLSIDNGHLQVKPSSSNTGAYLYSKLQFSYPIAVSGKYMTELIGNDEGDPQLGFRGINRLGVLHVDDEHAPPMWGTTASDLDALSNANRGSIGAISFSMPRGKWTYVEIYRKRSDIYSGRVENYLGKVSTEGEDKIEDIGNTTSIMVGAQNGGSASVYWEYMFVRAYASPAPTITRSSGNPTSSHIHIDGKNCVNMPFVARLTDTLGNPIASGTIIYSLGGAQFIKTTDVSGYSTFTPTTTGTLLALHDNESVTCEIIDDPTLCTGGCNFGTDPQADDLAITSFTTDKTTYAGGETMTITIAVLNSAGEMYKKLLIDTSSTKSDTGLPLGFVGSWSFVDLGSSTYEMRLYIPTSTDPGTYNVAGGVYTDYLADGGLILDIASPVSVTIT